MDENQELHKFSVALEVVEQDMLLGANSLTKVGAVLDCGNLKISLSSIFGDKVKFPLNYGASGHFTLDFYSMAKEDGYEAAQTFLVNEDWTHDTASKLLTYIHNNMLKKQLDCEVCKVEGRRVPKPREGQRGVLCSGVRQSSVSSFEAETIHQA